MLNHEEIATIDQAIEHLERKVSYEKGTVMETWQSHRENKRLLEWLESSKRIQEAVSLAAAAGLLAKTRKDKHEQLLKILTEVSPETLEEIEGDLFYKGVPK